MPEAHSLRSKALDLVAKVPKGLFIGGKWREGDGVISVTNPADGSVVMEMANGTVDHALLALDAAAKAQPDWTRVAPRARANLMHAAHRLLLEREEIIVTAMTLESGKPMTEARAEFKLSADFFLWFAEQTAHLHGTFAMSSHGGFRVLVAQQPIDFANETRFGLASYLFTRDLTRALSIGEKLEFGMVGINRGIMADPAAPFGGTKASGIGREAGLDGIYEFLEKKYMAVTVQDAGGIT